LHYSTTIRFNLISFRKYKNNTPEPLQSLWTIQQRPRQQQNMYASTANTPNLPALQKMNFESDTLPLSIRSVIMSA